MRAAAGGWAVAVAGIVVEEAAGAFAGGGNGGGTGCGGRRTEAGRGRGRDTAVVGDGRVGVAGADGIIEDVESDLAVGLVARRTVRIMRLKVTVKNELLTLSVPNPQNIQVYVVKERGKRRRY